MLEVGEEEKEKERSKTLRAQTEYFHLTGRKLSRQSLRQNYVILGIVTNGDTGSTAGTHSKHRRDK